MIFAFAALFLQIQVVPQSLGTSVLSAKPLVQEGTTPTLTSFANRSPSVLRGSSRLNPPEPTRNAPAGRHVLALADTASDSHAEDKGARTASGAAAASATGTSTGTPAPAAFKPKPESPDTSSEVRTIREKHLWYALIGVQHSAATFDAWSTRDSVESGQRRELNPLLRPFSHSGAIYGAVQVAPALFDYIGYRMMGSHRRWVRQVWWLPQASSAALFFWSGAHNLRASH